MSETDFVEYVKGHANSTHAFKRIYGRDVNIVFLGTMLPKSLYAKPSMLLVLHQQRSLNVFTSSRGS